MIVTCGAVIVMRTIAWAKKWTAHALITHGHQGSAALLNADAAETLLCACSAQPRSWESANPVLPVGLARRLSVLERG